MRAIKKTSTITNRDSIAVNKYLHEISRYPLISVEEEVELAQKIRQGGEEAEQARKRLVEANLRFVVTVANTYTQRGMDYADLIAEGNIGLMKAAERFDETRGVKFISFAVWWIRETIMKAIVEHKRTIRIPANKEALLRRCSSVVNEFMHREYREPSDEEVAEKAGVCASSVRQLMIVDTPVSSIDSPLSDKADAKTLGEMLVSDQCTDKTVLDESFHFNLQTALHEVLSERECEVILRSFGIGCPEEGLDEIGEFLNLSRERVRQIREKAIVKLRKSPDARQLLLYA